MRGSRGERGPDIRPVRRGDDLGWELDLSLRAFGGPSDEEGRQHHLTEAAEAADDGRLLAGFDGQRMVATAGFHDMRQWWHGRSLPMAGVTGVQVAPEERGRGVGSALTAALLRVLAERGYPLSVLYPATGSIYRALGWELAGVMYEAVVPARSLGSLLPPAISAGSARVSGPATVRRAGPGDAEEVIAVIGGVHELARHRGPATYDARMLRRWLADPGLFCYLARDGFLAYRWRHGSRELLVECAVAGSAETTRAIWAIVGSHSTMARQVRARVCADDPVGWLIREPDLELTVRQRKSWMLRVLDAQAAIAGRGFPPAGEVTAVVRLADDQLPANSGTWRLEVSGGRAVLSPYKTDSAASVSAPAPVTLGPRGFAATYGGIPLATLRLAGLAAGGDPATDAALDTAFGGPSFLLDDF